MGNILSSEQLRVVAGRCRSVPIQGENQGSLGHAQPLPPMSETLQPPWRSEAEDDIAFMALSRLISSISVGNPEHVGRTVLQYVEQLPPSHAMCIRQLFAALCENPSAPSDPLPQAMLRTSSTSSTASMHTVSSFGSYQSQLQPSHTTEEEKSLTTMSPAYHDSASSESITTPQEMETDTAFPSTSETPESSRPVLICGLSSYF